MTPDLKEPDEPEFPFRVLDRTGHCVGERRTMAEAAALKRRLEGLLAKDGPYEISSNHNAINPARARE